VTKSRQGTAHEGTVAEGARLQNGFSLRIAQQSIKFGRIYRLVSSEGEHPKLQGLPSLLAFVVATYGVLTVRG
jgi:hypothetical protein